MRLSALEIQALEAATCGDSWNRIVARVQANHGGRYPSDWYEVVLAPGRIWDRHLKAGVVRGLSTVVANSWGELLDKLGRPL